MLNSALITDCSEGHLSLVSSEEGCANHDQVLVLFETITLCPLTHPYVVSFTIQLVFDRVVIRTIVCSAVVGDYMREGSNEASLTFPGQKATTKSCSESHRPSSMRNHMKFPWRPRDLWKSRRTDVEIDSPFTQGVVHLLFPLMWWCHRVPATTQSK